jgi:hypothetical protein
MITLFDEFIYDAGSHTCRQILDAVHARAPERVISEFNSNCFEVTINYVDGSALLEDVLDISAHRKHRFRLDEFVLLLAQAEAVLKAEKQH